MPPPLFNFLEVDFVATFVVHTSVRGPRRLGVAAGPTGALFKVVTGTITFSTSYTTGGEEVDLRPYLRDLKLVLVGPKGGYSFTYDLASRKVLAYRYDYPAAAVGPAVEVAAAVDLSVVGAVSFVAFGL